MLEPVYIVYIVITDDSDRGNKLIQETRLSPRLARSSVSVEMLSYCCTNNANRSRGSL